MINGCPTQTYINTIESRLGAQLEAFAKQDVIKEGYVVPDEESTVLGTGTRIDTVILFLDIASFSGRLSNSSLEQDHLLRALNLFFCEMARIINDYGGHIEKNTGDSLMAYFPDSPLNYKAVEQAVSAALTMFFVNNRYLKPILRAVNILPFDFRISLDYGKVTIGRLGAPHLFNSLVAVGTTANIASKIQKFAKSDEIVMGEAAYFQLSSERKKRSVRLWFVDSGWYYLLNGQKYPVYKYNGRWINI